MTNDMTKGAITPLLIRFTIPLVLGNLFQLTYNAADSIIVGKFVGEEALAAVGTSNPLMTLAILFINGMCLGAGILVSTAFGAGNTQLMERQVSTTAIAGTVFSLAFSALCVIPLERHLWGLKQAVYDRPYENTVPDPALPGFTLAEQRTLRNTITLRTNADIEALFCMTPYYYKTGARDQAKLHALDTLTTETEFALLIYRKA